ncbi:MAG TPA: prenyltransferase/squalene oxidase repeat-containing protein, partial [Thermoguttaceae bacterium]
YTRWGQSHQLEKCMALSLLAHVLMLCYAATLSIVMSGPRGSESVCYIALDDSGSGDGAPGSDQPKGEEQDTGNEQTWEAFNRDVLLQPKTPELLHASTDDDLQSKGLMDDLEKKLLSEPSRVQSVLDELTEPEAKPAEVSPPIGRLVAIDQAQLSNDDISSESLREATALPRKEADDQNTRDDSSANAYDSSAELAGTGSRGSNNKGRTADWQFNGDMSLSRSPAGISDGTATDSLPEIYKLRVMPGRYGVAQQHGATSETELAVRAALKWLANNQAPDGRWIASEHGGGQELGIQGRNRQNAGRSADTGITGLALLSFLAAGHTHQQSPYSDNVRRGLEYLMRIQARDGNLGGNGAAFEFMYCHAMAACALSEAYGMTHDSRLEKAVRRAIDFTIAAQDPRGGGWRYKPGDPGDTSQLGWQLMALKSAELAGIPLPASTRNGIIRFLQSVSYGTHGGLASYRPGERISRAMTAEALVCRQFLGIAREHPACNEAGDYLLGELPGSGIANDYYWYYATLGMYQLQGSHWEQWNEALRTTLVDRQVKEGPLAGSWNTDTLWGSYGGRVYTTAIAALTLEVYYRFLPLYVATVPDGQRAK